VEKVLMEWNDIEQTAIKEIQEEERRKKIDAAKEALREHRKKLLTEKKVSFKILGYEFSFTFKKRGIK
jgi:hypothetical protein